MANKCAIFREKSRRLALCAMSAEKDVRFTSRTSGFLREELRRCGPVADVAKPAAVPAAMYLCLYGQMIFD